MRNDVPSLDDRNEIIEAYWPRILRAAAGYEQNAAIRDELAQDMAVEIWRALPAFANQCSLKTYIYRVIHNVAVDHIRRVTRQIKTLPGATVPPLHDGETSTSPEHDIEHAQQQQRLMQAIQKLPLSLRQILMLKLEDLSHNEIADTLGLTETNVAVRLNRAKPLLLKHLQGTAT